MNETSNKHIQHLVFSGGGPAGLINYGAVKQLAKENVWSLAAIKSIYGCSVGAFLGIIVSLGYDWDWLDDYFIKRPWEKMFSLSAQTILDAYDEKGLLGEKLFLEALKPLFRAKDLSEHCTLKELYEFNHIDIHLFTTNINTERLTKVDLSYKTHPDITVLTALCMSTSYPLAFKPVCIADDCFIDGGLMNNFPLNDCLDQTGCKPEDVLAFKNSWVTDVDHGTSAGTSAGAGTGTSAGTGTNTDIKITQTSTIIDYMLILMKKMQKEICTERQQRTVLHIVTCHIKNLAGLSNWIKALATEDMRAMLINQGVEDANAFLQSI